MKTSELTGPALDWAVAKCEGHDVDMARGGWVIFDTHQDDPPPFNEYNDNRWHQYSPSTDWAQGGPIIEREGIDIHRVNSVMWSARWWADNSGMVKNPAQRFRHNINMDGPRPLAAAMRCYVASKLGNEIEIPNELRG